MLQLKETHDGSFTLFNETINETYHSIHGARQEALHVFIKTGLEAFNQFPINILEVGLGTGLNAMLTFSQIKEKAIHYVALEPFPIDAIILTEIINFNAINNDENTLWNQLIATKSNEIKSIDINSTFCWHQQTLQEYKTQQKFDLVYFDAFAPNKQSEMWDVSIFEKLYDLMNDGAMIVTYCAQGQFKRNLKAAGFNVEAKPGPIGKREMTVGYKEL